MSHVQVPRVLAFGLLALLAGCAEPRHLTYDFGRAYAQAFTAQADLTRPSAATEQYALYGIEGVQIRLLVQKAVAETKSGEVTLTQE